MYVCHGANGSLDDSLSNLYWATPKQNSADKYRDGTMANHVGERNPNAKLNGLQVRVIRQSYRRRGKGGLTLGELGEVFRISFRTVYDIVSGHQWRHLP